MVCIKKLFLILMVFMIASCIDNKVSEEHDFCDENYHDENVSRYCIDIVDSVNNITKHTLYDLNGNIWHYGYMKGDLEEGLYVEYYETGEIAATLSNKNGLIEGFETTFHRNGQISCISSVVRNLLDGYQVCYCERGNLIDRRFFHKGNLLFDYDYSKDSIKKVIPIVTIDSVVVKDKPIMILFNLPYFEYIKHKSFYVFYDFLQSENFDPNNINRNIPNPKLKVKIEREVFHEGFLFLSSGERIFYGSIGLIDSIDGRIKHLYSLPIQKFNVID